VERRRLGQGGRALQRRRRLIAAALFCALAPATAQGAATQESLVEDELQMLQAGPAARERALDDVVALGADGVRALVAWDEIAPSPRSSRRPAGFDPADPAAYPPARWDRLDGLVRGAHARGISLLLSPATPAPLWATRCKGSASRRRLCPDGAQYGAFLRALGRRYSGSYADENEGRGVLPRVRRWSFSNEPNQPSSLRPQFARADGITYPAAAVAYRSMVRGGIAGLRASGHGGDQLLLGETSPIGRVTGRLATRPAPPAAFIRTLLCIDGDGDALRGKQAAVRDCRKPRRLRVSGFAHHPYSQGGSKPPHTLGRRATEITIASIGRLARLLDAAAKLRRIPRALPIHYTEFGFQTNPPDLLFGITPARQAEYVNQSDWIAYRDERIRSVAQYKLVDDTAVSSFQSGLRFWDGTPKPAYDAYRLPLWITRKGSSRLRVYGQVRPLAAGARSRVQLQNAALGAGPFRTVATFTVRSANNTFLRTIPRREGRFRLRWIAPDGSVLLSRESVTAAR
jgi:hypothetical protein